MAARRVLHCMQHPAHAKFVGPMSATSNILKRAAVFCSKNAYFARIPLMVASNSELFISHLFSIHCEAVYHNIVHVDNSIFPFLKHTLLKNQSNVIVNVAFLSLIEYSIIIPKYADTQSIFTRSVFTHIAARYMTATSVNVNDIAT